jgi:hypothetical protein
MGWLAVMLVASACASAQPTAPRSQPALPLGPPIWVPGGDPTGGVFIEPYAGHRLPGR